MTINNIPSPENPKTGLHRRQQRYRGPAGG